MFQARIHGRGGQGVVTAAELLSTAAFLDGLYAQAFPSFGSERMGAPVVSFCRIDDRPIRRHDPVTEADAVVVQDSTLLHEVDLFKGLHTDGWVLINSARSIDDLGLDDLASGPGHRRLITCSASDICRRLTGRPLPNAALLGALAEMTGSVRLESVCKAIRRRLPGEVGETNAESAVEAARLVRLEHGSRTGA